MSANKDSYHNTVLDLEAKLKKNVDLIMKLGNSLQGMFMLGPKPLSVYDPRLKHGPGYQNPYTLKQAISQCPKLYLASSLNNSEIPLDVRDTKDILDDASKSKNKMKEKMNDPIALSAEQKYFPSSFISSAKTSNATSYIPASMPNNSLHDEFEQLQRNSIEIQEGMQARIKILEKDVQRCQKQSVDFELKLQHEKEKHKWDSSLKNDNANSLGKQSLDYSWISKMEKLENENVSLDFKVQSLIKERDNTSPDKQRVANSIKNVIAPGMYKVVTKQESQIKETKSGLSSTGMNVASSVRRPMNRDSHVKKSVLANSKISAMKVEVYVRKNKQTEPISANVISNKENVIDVDVANAPKAKVVLCVSLLEVAFCSKTCYVRNLKGDDLLTRDRESNLYTISIYDMAASSPVCLMSKATSTKSWLWHCRLSHLNFGTINNLTRLDLVDGLPKFKYGKDHLCSACERGKSKKASHPPKLVSSNHSKLEMLHMDLCGPMRVASINGKKYILVIVDDYSRYTWVCFLYSKDETPEIIKKFITQAQLNYKAKVCKIRTDNGTEFKNATLKAHYEKLGIMQQFSTTRTP
ncbi:integrase, catalytic region, zinc finger, CCHC-type containing protein [Tanacetum coccineum]|uniref:Integrase, catalytic region, zinc finger, CCHC-type containing protein n=1 Tax=Tanacetum coccineum TaxID=301880 RepID=A0ABQ5H741_9ASTR